MCINVDKVVKSYRGFGFILFIIDPRLKKWKNVIFKTTWTEKNSCLFKQLKTIFKKNYIKLQKNRKILNWNVKKKIVFVTFFQIHGSFFSKCKSAVKPKQWPCLCFNLPSFIYNCFYFWNLLKKKHPKST